MRRTAVLLVVLTLLAGPGVSAICDATCEPQAARNTACRHEDTDAPQTISECDSCIGQPASIASVIESRRRVSTSQVRDSEDIAPTPSLHVPFQMTFGREPQYSPPIGPRPFVVTLRI